MRLVDFETVLVQSIQACGLDRYNINEQTFSQIRDFASYRLKYIWEYDTWPDLVRTTKLTVTNSDTTHYIVIPDDGVITNTEGTFKIDIGTILQVTVEDPRITGKVHDIGWSFDEYETQLGNTWSTVKRLIIDKPGLTEAYVTYRISCPELNGDLFNSTNAYLPGQMVYWAYQPTKYVGPTISSIYAGKKGNFWKALVQTTEQPNFGNNSIPTISDKWEKVKIPAFACQYLVKGIHADWLKSEMQIEYSQMIDMEAQTLLDAELNKVIVQSGQVPRIKFNNIY